MAEEHPTHLMFKDVKTASEYMKKMELPNWPLAIEKATGNGWGPSRKTAITSGDVSMKIPGYEDIKITDMGDGKIMVHVDATTGRTLGAIGEVAYLDNAEHDKIKTLVSDTTLNELQKDSWKVRSIISNQNELCDCLNGVSGVWNIKDDYSPAPTIYSFEQMQEKHDALSAKLELVEKLSSLILGQTVVFKIQEFNGFECNFYESNFFKHLKNFYMN